MGMFTRKSLLRTSLTVPMFPPSVPTTCIPTVICGCVIVCSFLSFSSIYPTIFCKPNFYPFRFGGKSLEYYDSCQQIDTQAIKAPMLYNVSLHLALYSIIGEGRCCAIGHCWRFRWPFLWLTRVLAW